MPNTYGLVQLPIQPPVGDDCVSDKLLNVMGDFLQTFINHYGAAAWQAVMPNSLPVQTVRFADPEDLGFNERDLPALHLWRAGTGNVPPDSLSEDVYIMRDQVYAFWVFPPARQAFRAIRESYVSGMSKLVHVAIELGRDPCWVVPGDPDPLAATYGSVFPRHAGWVEMIFSKWQDRFMVEEMADNTRRRYPALFATFDVAEMFEFDLSLYDELKGLDQKIYDPTNTLLVVERDTTVP